MDFKNVPKGSVGAMSALVKVGIIGGIGLYATSNSLYNVEGGCRAIVFNRLVGVKERFILREHISWFRGSIGLSLMMFMQRPTFWKVLQEVVVCKMVKIGLRVLTRPEPDQLPTIYRTLGENYNKRYLNIGTRVAVLDLKYPWRLLACSECKQFGHKETTCPQKTSTYYMSICPVNTQIAIVPDPIAAPIIACDTIRGFIQEGNPYLALLGPDDDNEEEIEVFSDHEIDDQDVHAGVETFGRNFAAIEAKQIATKSEKEPSLLWRKRARQEGCGYRARGEAKSAHLIGQAIANNAAFITLRKIEAAGK
ncbi:hypothetical protein IFM89_031904 [Coptis chinensis]|uniref:Prohibitin n=1 Tax=Coptis chinensis TaxID=261450 RepID=A0A835IRF6_9MAGN|nr:hypothetical protein IFM89_031904 [Coptis chinensis]